MYMEVARLFLYMYCTYGSSPFQLLLTAQRYGRIKTKYLEINFSYIVRMVQYPRICQHIQHYFKYPTSSTRSIISLKIHPLGLSPANAFHIPEVPSIPTILPPTINRPLLHFILSQS